MNDDSEKLPEMSEAVLSDDEVAALVRDLRACTEIMGITIKSGPGGADDQRQLSIDEAAQLLLERAVRGVQVRYRYDGAGWTDTLMPTADGIRLVRIRNDEAAGA